MEGIYKINERYTTNARIGASDIYRKFKVQFDALLDPGEVARSDDEFEKMYVRDENFEDKIEKFRNSIGNMASYCVGYTGIGKTTSIRHCFSLGVKNVTKYVENRKELVFPAFYDGHNLETDYKEDLAQKISGVCSYLERENPEVRSFLRSENGIKAFYHFIENTKPEILEDNPLIFLSMSEMEEITHRLNVALERHKYSYYAIRLKFLIAQRYDRYKRLIIILDDIESLPHDYQQNLLRQYLSFYECMTRTVYPETGTYNVNLLICLRPHTLRLFNNSRSLETYPIRGTPITKDNAIDLAKMLKRRFDYYTGKVAGTIGNIDTWRDSYDALDSMNKMFAGQYKKMIINLCFMNIRESLSYYASIFANRFWIQKNKELYAEFTVDPPDYIFNNITIIRAISCNEGKVYFGEATNILPNLLFSTHSKDYSIYCLLLIKLFYLRRVKGEPYGLKATKMSELIRELHSIFDEETTKAFEKCIFYLFEKKIFRKSIRDKDDYSSLDRKESLKDDSQLYLSSKGEEMWRMLAQDSVLLELFREDAFRDYETYDFNDAPSFYLMSHGDQEGVFFDLLKYIESLRNLEDDLRNSLNEDNRKKFDSTFGKRMVVSQLLYGVERSMRYSGKMENPQIKSYYESLRKTL